MFLHPHKYICFESNNTVDTKNMPQKVRPYNVLLLQIIRNNVCFNKNKLCTEDHCQTRI